MALSFLQSVVPAPPLRPQFNVGCMFDIQCGNWLYGKYGEAILNGGVAHVTGVTGRGNTFKTVLLLFFFLQILDRYESGGMAYDTELTLTIRRLRMLAKRMINFLLGVDFNPSAKFVLTDKTKYDGTKWFEMLKELTEHRKKRLKADMAVSPFLDEERNFIEMLIPFVVAVDSMSEFAPANVVKKQEDVEIGSSDRNMEAMDDARVKTQLIRELGTLCDQNGIVFMSTIHMGDGHVLDPYAASTKKLTFMKGNQKFKNVPEKASFLLNNIWWVMGSAPMINPKGKTVEFPRDSNDDLKGDTDLMLLSVSNLRGKNGNTGFPFDLIVSQRDGVEEDLTHLYYLMSYGRYGLGGNLQNYNLDLYPSLTLSRTTVRRKLAEDPKARRALQITSYLCQMINYRTEGVEDIMCTPKELYDGIIAKGYNWDDILSNTREWWTFDNDSPKHKLKFLSTVDLLNMRAGLYKPFWMKEKGVV